MNQTCKHETVICNEIELEDEFTGEIETHEHIEIVETYDDVDLHRYKCTQCNEIFYYSSSAKDHYENGTRYEGIKGLC